MQNSGFNINCLSKDLHAVNSLLEISQILRSLESKQDCFRSADITTI